MQGLLGGLAIVKTISDVDSQPLVPLSPHKPHLPLLKSRVLFLIPASWGRIFLRGGMNDVESEGSMGGLAIVKFISDVDSQPLVPLSPLKPHLPLINRGYLF